MATPNTLTLEEKVCAECAEFRMMSNLMQICQECHDKLADAFWALMPPSPQPREARGPWRLREAYDLDTDELIVDEVAIERAVSGQPGEGAWITRTEAVEAFRIMQRRGYDITEIAENIGCGLRTVTRWAAGEFSAPASQTRPAPPPKRLTPEQREAKRLKDRERVRQQRAALKAAAFSTAA